MYLYLNEIYKHPAADDSIETALGAPELSSGAGANGPTFVPFYTVSRSGAIHHAWQHRSDLRKRLEASRKAL